MANAVPYFFTLHCRTIFTHALRKIYSSSFINKKKILTNLESKIANDNNNFKQYFQNYK